MKKLFITVVWGIILTGAGAWTSTPKANAQEGITLEEAFKTGKINGTIGNYFEFKKMDLAGTDTGWSTAYLTLKYENQEWNRLNLGARFFAHGQLYTHDESGATDPFDVDIESPFTLPELYLNLGIMEKSLVRAGRFEHGKISHIDDTQSEGAYVQLKEMENLDIVGGIMRRFAEIDYDDGEDFGRNNDSQNLDSASYGDGSSAYLLFLETTYTGIDLLKLNPYLMAQNGYANVFGLDTTVEAKLEDPALSFGSNLNYYFVDADIAGSGDSNNYKIEPFVKLSPVSFSIGYARFDKGNALNKPAWLVDYFLPLDQTITYGNPDSEVFFTKVKLTLGDFWTHFAFSDSQYSHNSSTGDGSQEYELQFGYKFPQNIELNLRLFDVQFDNISDKDYQKVESLVKYNF